MITRIPTFPIWVFGALSALTLGQSAGPVFWRLTGDTSHVPVSVQDRQIAEKLRFDLAPILAFLPFGSSVETVAVQEVTGETSLGLVLLGVTISVPASGSRAIISGGDGPARGYFVGEIITASASVNAIEPDHVVLSVDGRLETLSFAKRGSGAVSPQSGPNLRNLIPSTDQAGAAVAADSNEPDAVIARYRAAIELDAQGVMDRLGVENTDQGYRITDSASPGVRQAGFKAGDVVTTVNGQKVGDMAADRGYFDEVAASGRARVELLRDGQTIVMSFPLR